MANDPSAMINSLLSDPAMIKKVGELISSLGKSEENKDSTGGDDFLNPETLLKIKNVYEKLQNDDDDPRTKLLLALKPYLNEKRLTGLDNALKMMRMSKMTGLLNDLDILKSD